MGALVASWRFHRKCEDKVHAHSQDRARLAWDRIHVSGCLGGSVDLQDCLLTCCGPEI
jgi:hypothetical protein